jgi:hypothetical protein
VAGFWSKLAYFGYKPGGMRRVSAFGSFGLALLGAAAVVAALGLWRLGRQFPGASESPGLLVPFLVPVLTLALEAGALVALSSAQLAGLSRGVPGAADGPVARARLALPWFCAFALAIAIAELIPKGTEHPGAFANDLVRTARESCSAGARVSVPLLGFSVRCDAPQRIEGPMPGAAGVQLAMRDLTFSDDLRRVSIEELELTAARSLQVRLRAGSARIRGLAPWSRSPLLSPLGRFGVLAALGAVLWLVASYTWRRLPRADDERAPAWHRWLARVLFALPGAVAAFGFISLDQERAAPASYAVAALASALVSCGLAVLGRRIPRIFSSFGSL